jgi:predicted hotdog family 3-hydroxylacyl-ACP dehydratase
MTAPATPSSPAVPATPATPAAPATPATLNHDGIARRVPHAGRMCLLHTLDAWSDEHIACSAVSHTAADHPLRTASGLLAPCAIEYAAQAMALHGALCAERADPNARPTPGFLASVRAVMLHVPRLDTLASPLLVQARCQVSQGTSVLYDFSVQAGDEMVAQGRATVVLNTPLAA